MNPASPPVRSSFNPWPVSIIGFFTLAIIGCASFIVFCSRHPADLVANDYYEQEVRYQGQIDRLQHASARAQAAKIAYDPATKQISISLPSTSGQSRPEGSIQLYRPSAVNLDRQLKLEANASGVQTLDASHLLPGLWRVRVSWTVDRQDYFIDQRIVIGSTAS